MTPSKNALFALRAELPKPENKKIKIINKSALSFSSFDILTPLLVPLAAIGFYRGEIVLREKGNKTTFSTTFKFAIIELNFPSLSP